MLEKFKKDNDIHRKRVLETIENGIWSLEKFNLEEFNEYPGGMALVDSKRRRILIYDDFIMGDIKVIYEDLKKEETDITIDILDTLWNSYSNIANQLCEIARLRRDEEGHIIFYRYKINENEKIEKVHESEEYEENNQLYDIHEYLITEIKCMKKKIKEGQYRKSVYYEM